MPSFTAEQLAFLEKQRVGRLASANFNAAPHVVPVCYACDGQRLYIALDSKPKRVAPARLRRVRNILENPQVALVIDRYSEDWETLAYLLIEGSATLLPSSDPGHSRAIGLLRGRYPQYQAMPIEQQPVIAIEPTKIVGWGALRHTPQDEFCG
jgi:coenzyme F420-0:L-glutamate ligase/coenzyme F420-1:gamma-L-glutamate ligase